MVTGGASGMGEATCHELGRRGHAVAVLDLNEVAAQRVADALRADGVTALAVAVDVTDHAAVDEAFAKVRTELGPVHILVTSAGMVTFAPFDRDHPAGRGQRIIDVNLTGTFHCCQVALPDMIEAGWGRIVMISSSSAQRGSPGMAHYAASKGALISLTKSFAREYGPVGHHRQQHSAVGYRDADAAPVARPPGTCRPMSRWRPAFRSGTSAPATTSRRRWASCARRKPVSSPAKPWVSTGDR